MVGGGRAACRGACAVQGEHGCYMRMLCFNSTLSPSAAGASIVILNDDETGNYTITVLEPGYVQSQSISSSQLGPGNPNPCPI